MTFNIKGMRERIRRVLEEEGREHKRLLRWTTRRWKGIQPQFASTTVVSPQRIYINTEPRGRFPPPKGSRTGAAKWWYLELGTRIRWALMSSDWRSGSRPGRLRPRMAAGKVLIAGRRAMTSRNIGPRPGIEPRNWRAEVVKMRSRKFKGRLKREFDIIAKNTITPAGLRR